MAKPLPSLDDLLAEIEHWFADTMRNSVVSREVAIYNHVQAAYEELKSRITALVSTGPAKPSASEETVQPSATDTKSKPAA